MGGAVEKMWFELGKIFATEGHKVVQISRRAKDLPAHETIDGVQHLRVGGYDTPRSLLKLKFLDLLYTLRAASKLPPADILVTNTFWSPILVPKQAGAIYVDVARMPKGQMRFYHRARRLRANSTPVAEAIIRECPASATRVKVIPNPLPFAPSQDVDWEKKEKRILYAGRIHPEKGLPILLDAFAQCASLDGWTLDMVGPYDVRSGGGGTEYFESLQRLHPKCSIHWHGPVNDTEALNEFYR